VQTPEFATAWRKSTYSAQNGSCVEVVFAQTAIGVRDSKKSDAGYLALASSGWHTFVAAVKADKLG
jgi:hypothetical protein